MAFLCPMVPERKPLQTVYTLKRARKRRLQTLRPLLFSGNEDTKAADLDDDDDNDSGISSYGTAGSGASPDLSKTELATKLATASPRHPARLKVRALWNFEPAENSELRVVKGELIQVLYKEDDWVLAVNCNGRRGFVPFNYCSLPLRKAECNTECLSFLDCPECVENSTEPRNQVLCHGSMDDMRTSRFMTRCSSETKVNATKLNALPGFRGLQHRSQSDDILLGNNSSSSEEDSFMPSKCIRRIYARQIWNSPNTSSANHNAALLRQKSSEINEGESHVLREASEFSEVTNCNRLGLGIIEEGRELTTMPFRKCPHFKAMVLYDFEARDEDDASVCKGDIVSVMNKDDEDWWWVVTPKGEEGFMPRAYLSEHLIAYSEDTPCSVESASSTSESSSTQGVRFQDPLCTFHSYEREDWEIDSDEDAEDDDRMESKYSTWC